MDATIGHITWSACNFCGHYDREEGCTVDEIEIIRDGDYVMCSEYIK